MASKNIKGITIDIGGNTTKLQDALKGVDKQVYSLNSDLKNLNQALKLDPKNTELLAQKQDVLARNIAATTQRLNTLKEAQRQMGDYNKLTDEQKKSYNQLSLEIAKSEKALKDMNKELKTTSSIDLSKLKDSLKKVGEVALEVSKKIIQVSSMVASALAGIVAAGVKSYADLEQNIGGINKLFEESADKVIENSKRAYKTAGISANQYMETATSFSASLLKSLGGDTEKAAELTDRAIRDMSDNANTFGSSMDEIMNVYKALSKEQYTTLDNLRLGYAGTKTGMQELIKDAASYKDIQEQLGITVDKSSLSFDNIINAISVMQTHLNITGTTMNEAEDTILGSLNSMKAAFDNFINGSGSPEDLADAISTTLKNIGKAISKLAPSILKGIVSLIKNIVPQIIQQLKTTIPELFSAVNDLIVQLCEMITTNTDEIRTTVTNIINQALDFITQNLPLILDAGVTILVTLIEGITNSIPKLAEALPQLITTICDILIESLPVVLNASIQLLMALVEAIPVVTVALVDKLPSIVDDIISTLLNNLPMLLDACIQLFFALIDAIPTIQIELVKEIPKIIVTIVKSLWDNRGKILESGKQILLSIKDGIIDNAYKLYDKIKDLPGNIKDTFLEGLDTIKDIGENVIKGIWNGISDSWDWITDKIKGWCGDFLGYIKKVLGISSPSKLLADEVGYWMAEGVGVGFEDEMSDVEKDMAKAIDVDALVNEVNGAMKSLNYGIQNSINPQINPNISLDQNYQMMAEAMKEALSTMEISLDDNEVGKFVSKTITEEIYGG